MTMKTYQLKPETIEKMRAVAMPSRYRARPGGSDILARRMVDYYSKPQYSTRTDKWKMYAGCWSPDKRGVYYAADWPAWRDLGDAGDISDYVQRGSGGGWYTDGCQYGTARGRVLQLPARDGQERYIAGVYQTDCDGVTVYPLDWYETADEAARVADEHARVAAEYARDGWEKEEAESQIEQAHGEARDAIGRFHILKEEARGNLNAPVCELVRRELRAMRALVRESMRRVRELRDTPSIVWGNYQ